MGNQYRGSARIRSLDEDKEPKFSECETRMMEKIVDDLAAATVLNRVGQPVSFRSLYEDGRTLIVFVRHFGCIFCRE